MNNKNETTLQIVCSHKWKAKVGEFATADQRTMSRYAKVAVDEKMERDKEKFANKQ